MGQISKIIQAIGIGTSIGMLLFVGQKAQASDRASRSQPSTQPKKTTANAEQTGLKDTLPKSILPNEQKRPLSNSDAVFLELISGEVAQADSTSDTSDTTADIIKPAQEAISDTQKLNPDVDRLSLPDQPEAVTVKEQKPITLEQAINLAFKNNRQIEEAQLTVERSKDELREEQAALYPTLGLGSGLTYQNSAFLDSAIEQRIDEQIEELQESDPNITEEQAREATEDRFTDTGSDRLDFSADLTLNYSLYDGGRRGASIRAARKQLQSSELNLEVITAQTRLDTASDYYDLQNSDAQVKIEDAAVEDAKQTLKDAQLLEKAGLGTRFDVLRAEVELAQAQQRLSTAIANQNIARRQLAETLSVAHDSDLSTADAIEEAGNWDLSLPESIVEAFDNRAELEQLLLTREINEEQRKIALANVRPALGASASYGLSDDLQDDFDTSDSYSVGLNFNWTLFDGGAGSAGARQAEKNIEIAETQFADQRNQIRFAVEQAFFGLESTKDNIGTATKEVELAEESLRLARLRFQAGVGTQTDVIEAQTQLTTARGNLLSSIIDYNQSYTDLQRQVSMLGNPSSENEAAENEQTENSELENTEPLSDESEGEE